MGGMRVVGLLAGMAGAALLSGCAADPRGALGLVPDFERVAADLDTHAFGGAIEQGVDLGWQEQPFARGTLALLWREAGALRSATLVPCRGGAVCAGDAAGPAGTLARSPSYLVVGGLMGRTFWLHPGGGGWVERDGRLLPLAWDARAGGPGRGDEAALETPAPHG